MKRRFIIIFSAGFLGVCLGFFYIPPASAQNVFHAAEISHESTIQTNTASNITEQQVLIHIPTAERENVEHLLADTAVIVDALTTEQNTTTLIVRTTNNATIEDMQSILPGVEHIEVDTIRRMLMTPNDPFYSQQWQHSGVAGSIQSPFGWDVSTGSSSVVIAVIDSGVDLNHPDLNDNLWVNGDEIPSNGIDDDANGFVDDVHGFDFTTNTANAAPSPNDIDEDRDGFVDGGVNHGTHVAGIIAAEGNNGVGVSGVLWDAQIMAVQVLDDEGAGFDSDIAEGIRYAADNGADIINLSLGGYGSTTVLESAVTYANSKGTLVVAAAGNDGRDIRSDAFFPACYANVIGVASIGQSGAASSFSNFGSTCVDVSAPGELILSTLYEDATNPAFVEQYGLESGTSMATPSVSGVAGLLVSVHPAATRTQLQELVIAATRTHSGLSAQYGIGSIDASKIAQEILLSSVKAYESSKKKILLKTTNVYAVQKPFFEWTTPTGADVVRYYVYFGTNPNANPVSNGVSQTSRKFTPKINAAGDQKNYYLRLQAETSTGALSNILTYTHVVDTVVSAPKNVKARQAQKKSAVAVTWKKVSNQNVVQYQVIRQKKSGGRRTVIKKTTKNTFTDTAVKKGTTYQYTIKAKDDLGNTKDSKKVTVKVR